MDQYVFMSYISSAHSHPQAADPYFTTARKFHKDFTQSGERISNDHFSKQANFFFFFSRAVCIQLALGIDLQSIWLH